MKQCEDANERADLYIGLVCAAGTDLTEVRNQLKAQLSVVGYKNEELKVSNLIAELLEISEVPGEYNRISELMSGGDCLRECSENGQGVASAIIAEIRRRRLSDNGPNSTAFIIDSLKNPSEIELLDQVYGRNYYTLSVFLPREDRVTNLQNKIAKSLHEPPNDDHRISADALVREDEKGSGKKSQNVQESFPKADFFMNGTKEVAAQARRFVELIFRQPFTTPTADEYHMFVAKAAALRSCDLSRQVGAVIVDAHQSIVATGCNEVPYPSGGIFYEGRGDRSPDNRDHTKGHDPNWIEIQRSLIELIGVLRDAGHISGSETSSQIAEGLLFGKYKELMSNARVRNLIEFGRVVHAEMHALSQAAAVGRAVKGATLYCTTFPCHGCARHIIASGIAEVVFIEPYPKSLTQQLYDGEIEISHEPLDQEQRNHIKCVRFRPFHGVAPSLYQRVFSYRDRKDQYGNIATWDPKAASPVGAILGVERPSVELAASIALAAILEKAKAMFATKKRGGFNAEAITAGAGA
jgi:deoxycytidylate deaminase